ncbi:hypothetical protein AMELA_G00087040, partial [Ameiurus melas]
MAAIAHLFSPADNTMTENDITTPPTPRKTASPPTPPPHNHTPTISPTTTVITITTSQLRQLSCYFSCLCCCVSHAR